MREGETENPEGQVYGAGGRNGEMGKVSRQASKTDRRIDGQADRRGDRSPVTDH